MSDVTDAAPDPLRVENLTVRIAGRVLLDEFSLTVGAGQSVAVMGPSGTGKSTLIRCILGGLRPDGGRVLVAGTDVHRLRPGAARRHRAEHVGVVLQHGELLGELTALENAAVPLLLAGTRPVAALRRAAVELEALRIADVAGTRADDLSGGEQQRTALARALVTGPGLVLADEPTGALDTASRDIVAEHLIARCHAAGAGLMLVTHDAEVAARCDRTVELADDRLDAASRAGAP